MLSEAQLILTSVPASEIRPQIYIYIGMTLKLKLQYFGHLIGKVSDAGRDWGAGGKGDDRG